MEEHRPGRAIKDSHSYFQPLTLSSCLFQGNVVSELKLGGGEGSDKFKNIPNFKSIRCRSGFLFVYFSGAGKHVSVQKSLWMNKGL